MQKFNFKRCEAITNLYSTWDVPQRKGQCNETQEDHRAFCKLGPWPGPHPEGGKMWEKEDDFLQNSSKISSIKGYKATSLKWL